MIANNERTPPVLRERLKLMLSELGIKQTEFAKSLGISANYIYLLTSGRKENISGPLARLIESTYGYSATWILRGEGCKTAAPPATESLKSETIRRVRSLSPRELKAVATFLKSLEETKN